MNAIRYQAGPSQPSTIALSVIRTDGGTQSRVGISDDVVADYATSMSSGATFPKIVVFYDGSEYWLADGFHRLAAFAKVGLSVVEADVQQGTQRDAVLFSLRANSTHGLRRTDADKRQAVTRMLSDSEWSTWSDREIARHCGVSHPFVAKVKADRASVTGNVTSDERTYITKHGTVATMNTAAIGGGRSPQNEEAHDDEITAEDLANDPGFQKAVEALNNAKALYDEVQAMPAPEPMTPEREALYKSAFGTPEDRSNLMAVINAVKLLDRLPTPDDMVRSVPPTMSHAVDAIAARKLSDWFEQFAHAWERREGVSA
jgi:hypothetical protein